LPCTALTACQCKYTLFLLLLHLLLLLLPHLLLPC
jgi:hypothetical protein